MSLTLLKPERKIMSKNGNCNLDDLKNFEEREVAE